MQPSPGEFKANEDVYLLPSTKQQVKKADQQPEFMPDGNDQQRFTTREREQYCSDMEMLAVSVRPYHLPREFSHVIVITVHP